MAIIGIGTSYLVILWFVALSITLNALYKHDPSKSLMLSVIIWGISAINLAFVGVLTVGGVEGGWDRYLIGSLGTMMLGMGGGLLWEKGRGEGLV